jgi:hypothetical protein
MATPYRHGYHDFLDPVWRRLARLRLERSLYSSRRARLALLMLTARDLAEGRREFIKDLQQEQEAVWFWMGRRSVFAGTSIMVARWATLALCGLSFNIWVWVNHHSLWGLTLCTFTLPTMYGYLTLTRYLRNDYW